MPERKPTIAETALQLIRERGPLTLDELAPLMVAAGRTAAKDPRRAVAAAIYGNRLFLEDLGGSYHSIADQLEGAVFTLRPTNLERFEEIVLVRADLALLARLLTPGRWTRGEDEPHLDFFGDYFELPPWDADILDVDDDGRLVFDTELPLRARIGEDTARTLLSFIEELGLPRGPGDDANLRDLLRDMEGLDVIHGPGGWLPLLGPRDLLGLRVEHGTIRAIALDRRSVSGAHVEAAAHRIARIAHRVIGPDASWFGPPAVDLELLLTLVATEAPELFRRPMPPVTDVIRRGGLEVEDGWVGHPGTDFDELFGTGSADAADAWGFDPPGTLH